MCNSSSLLNMFFMWDVSNVFTLGMNYSVAIPELFYRIPLKKVYAYELGHSEKVHSLQPRLLYAFHA